MPSFDRCRVRPVGGEVVGRLAAVAHVVYNHGVHGHLDRAMRVATLRKVPFLSRLSEPELQALALWAMTPASSCLLQGKNSRSLHSIHFS